MWSYCANLVINALVSIIVFFSFASLFLFIYFWCSFFFNFWILFLSLCSFSCSSFFAVLIGNTVIHLDKALARIREYERMKLKAEFNPCNASTAGAGGSGVSNAVHPSANPADQVEGTQPYMAAWVCKSTHQWCHFATTFCWIFFNQIVLFACIRQQKVQLVTCPALRLTPSSWIVRLKPSWQKSFPSWRYDNWHRERQGGWN